MPVLSVVTPVFREEKNVSEFLKRISPILQKITHDYEIIFCMDPSPDLTEQVILRHRSQDSRIKLLKFSRRFGQPMATMAGLTYSRGEAVIVIDVDLQDPPELILEMYEKYKNGFDVVYAQRRSRKGETLVKKIICYFGYKFINRIADVEIPVNTGDFRLMSRRVVNEVVKLKETHGFLRGLVALVGFSQTSVLFDRDARFQGKGNYNHLFGSLKIGLNGIVCFSNYLLTLSTTFGFASAGVAFIMAVIYLILMMLGSNFMTTMPVVVLLVLFLGGIQLITIGILGEYIGRIYDEVKGRPKFIVDQAFGFSSEERIPLEAQ